MLFMGKKVYSYALFFIIAAYTALFYLVVQGQWISRDFQPYLQAKLKDPFFSKTFLPWLAATLLLLDMYYQTKRGPNYPLESFDTQNELKAGYFCQSHYL